MSNGLVAVYRATGPTDAYLVKHWLERNGLVVHIQGDLVSARGEIPIGESWPVVWVPQDDQQRAEELVDAFFGPTLVHPRWRCPTCGEDNEPNFGSCWSCGGDRPDVVGRPVEPSP
jgi:hypothetical protein